jgi:predicted acyltransferase (DUF342 family)
VEALAIIAGASVAIAGPLEASAGALEIGNAVEIKPSLEIEYALEIESALEVRQLLPLPTQSSQSYQAL